MYSRMKTMLNDTDRFMLRHALSHLAPIENRQRRFWKGKELGMD